MKRSTAVIIAVLLIAACIADVYQTHLAEIRAMQDEGVKRLAASVDLGAYREAEQKDISAILEKAEAGIRGSEDQEEIDRLIEKAVAKTEGFKTDAVYATEEEGVAKLKAAVDLDDYREAEQTEIKKILDSTEAAILESEDPDEIEKLIKDAAAKFGEFKTDAEYTAEEEAARQAAASRQKKKKRKRSSRGCVGTGSDVFN